MKYWKFYASEELKAETQRIALQLNESDAEYIRKAVEQRNAYENTASVAKWFNHSIKSGAYQGVKAFEFKTEEPMQPHSNIPNDSDLQEGLNAMIDKVKEQQKGGPIPKPKQEFRSFPKGGK